MPCIAYQVRLYQHNHIEHKFVEQPGIILFIKLRLEVSLDLDRPAYTYPDNGRLVAVVWQAIKDWTEYYWANDCI